MLSHNKNTIRNNVNGPYYTYSRKFSFQFAYMVEQVTMTRRKIVLHPNDLPIKKTMSKSLKNKIVSRILVDFENTKFVEVVEPLVNKPVEELTCSDYKSTKVKIGKQSRLGYLQDAQDTSSMCPKVIMNYGKRRINSNKRLFI